MYARILTCVGIMTHVRRTFLPIPSMGDPEHTHPDSKSRCSIISIVTFSGGSSSTCRDRSCRIWGSAAVPLIASLIDNHASVSSSIGLSCPANSSFICSENAHRLSFGKTHLFHQPFQLPVSFRIPRALSKQFILFRTGERYHLRAVHLCIGLVFANLVAKNYPESCHFQCF